MSVFQFRRGNANAEKAAKERELTGKGTDGSGSGGVRISANHAAKLTRPMQ